MKNFIEAVFIITFLFVSTIQAEENKSMVTISNTVRNETLIIIDPQTHIDYGLAYPVTHEFSFSSGIDSLRAYRKFKLEQEWFQILEKTNEDFFNGIEAVRFDYETNIAYVSIGFSNLSDSIFIKIIDSQETSIDAAYLGMSQYYDNRDAVVTSTADDWANWCNEKFIQTCHVFRSYNLWLSCAIVTSGVDSIIWGDIQSQLDSGFVEAVAHSRTHPHIPYGDPEGEVLGSKEDIIDNLILPEHNRYGDREYVYAWVAPYGEYNEEIDSLVGEGNYLVTRMYYGGEHNFSSWAQELNKFDPVGVTAEVGPLWLGTTDSTELNNTFNEVVSIGGIYHVMCHPNILEWDEEYPWAHLDHISNRKNIWYAAFGHIYLYHFLQSVYSTLNTVHNEKNNSNPNKVTLYQNYPNPFNPITAISYRLDKKSFVDLSIYNLSGRNVETLGKNWQEKGNYTIHWDLNALDKNIPSGIYFYKLRTNNYSQTKRMVIVK